MAAGRSRRIVRYSILALVLAGFVWAFPIISKIYQLVGNPFVSTKMEEGRIAELVESEELILALTPELGRLSKNILNLDFPGSTGLGFFEPAVAMAPLDAHGEQVKSVEGIALTVTKYHASAEATFPSKTIKPLAPLLDDLNIVDYCKLYFVSGAFTDQSRQTYRSQNGLEGLAQAKDGSWRVLKGSYQLLWHRQPSAGEKEPASWKIAGWTWDHAKIYEMPHRVFAEVLDRAIDDPQLLDRLRNSEQDRILVDAATNKNFVPPTPYFDRYTFDRHPGSAVVDVDQDGFDDLYIMDQWTKNVLLRNKRDGTFENVAAERGLDIKGYSTSAIFADFDNDGDDDAVIGRSLERSLYLVNENGRFVDRGAELVSMPLPYLVSSVSAADYNGDGLLDLYFSTYASDTIDREDIWLVDERDQHPEMPANALLAKFLPRPQAEKLYGLHQGQHMFKARVGPPNVLLVNRGGRFELSPAAPMLEVWRNSYQSTWSDFDQDGDPDLYVANDFSANNLFRNDGGDRFTDVTESSKTADIGFGMGASWGDYDNDGKQDLYVSNMYSKAGRRITSQLEGMVDNSFQLMSRGNSLFKNCDDCFEKVSGEDDGTQQVEVGGWAWGGQFLDIDNDGYLDIFSTNGFYSAPRSVAIQLDL